MRSITAVTGGVDRPPAAALATAIDRHRHRARRRSTASARPTARRRTASSTSSPTCRSPAENQSRRAQPHHGRRLRRRRPPTCRARRSCSRPATRWSRRPTSCRSRCCRCCRADAADAARRRQPPASAAGIKADRRPMCVPGIAPRAVAGAVRCRSRWRRITSLGIGSGLDVNCIVTQLMALEREPLDALADAGHDDPDAALRRTASSEQPCRRCATAAKRSPDDAVGQHATPTQPSDARSPSTAEHAARAGNYAVDGASSWPAPQIGRHRRAARRARARSAPARCASSSAAWDIGDQPPSPPKAGATAGRRRRSAPADTLADDPRQDQRRRRRRHRRDRDRRQRRAAVAALERHRRGERLPRRPSSGALGDDPGLSTCRAGHRRR